MLCCVDLFGVLYCGVVCCFVWFVLFGSLRLIWHEFVMLLDVMCCDVMCRAVLCLRFAFALPCIVFLRFVLLWSLCVCVSVGVWFRYGRCCCLWLM